MKQLVIPSLDTSHEEVFETAAIHPLIAIRFGKIIGLQENVYINFMEHDRTILMLLFVIKDLLLVENIAN